MAHFIPTTDKTLAEGLARMFRDYVWKLHGLPESIISDRGVQFAANLMRELNQILGIKTRLSTAFHPQTNGQTEKTNQELEQYLRMFIDHRQECHKLHLAITPRILARFPRSKMRRKALMKTFQTMQKTCQSNQYSLRYQLISAGH